MVHVCTVYVNKCAGTRVCMNSYMKSEYGTGCPALEDTGTPDLSLSDIFTWNRLPTESGAKLGASNS